MPLSQSISIGDLGLILLKVQTVMEFLVIITDKLIGDGPVAEVLEYRLVELYELEQATQELNTTTLEALY
ncbi:hypothetical protein BBBOND_0210840 [Babesia bigemina]|uniref:Uncharacterized protein n=1 Tax=Babesia bigemina TaxID=5866 RepID=A0A061DAK7_BABBI|nr:hypothetical protein BBBOND_0210840 [Babesia bigemina]CDR95934.1 hypothetical protein BBBOND_0210840 [Babesia bigemina]|eukprot:XP_012768120.1 hypothetical protein BBBOND_0210840 [Babesia bigemina]